jgi:uncharacterized membrane protein
VTLAGWAAAIAGAAFVGGVAVVAGLHVGAFVPVLIGGLAGAAVDSIVGAAIQRRSWCNACQQNTEMRIHDCGAPTRHAGGLSWLENDGVNLIAALTGATTAWAMLVLTANGAPR